MKEELLVKPLVSIVIPVFNVENYIDKCLSSLEKLNYANFEVIIVNDSSTDNTVNIINKYCQNDTRFKLVNRPKQGTVGTIVDGVRLAKGQYISFVDADDFVGPDYLNNFLKFITGDEDIISCGFTYYGQQDKKNFFLKDGVYDTKEKILSLINTLVFNSSFNLSNTYFVSRRSKIYKAEIAKKAISFYSIYPLNYDEDVVFQIAALNFANKVLVTSELSGYFYRITDKIKNIDISSQLNNFDVIEKFFANNLPKDFYTSQSISNELQISLLINNVNILLSNSRIQEAKILLNAKKRNEKIKTIKLNKKNFKVLIYYLLIKYKLCLIWKVLIKIRKLY